MERHVKSAEEMQTFAREYVSGLSPRTGGATIVGLSGDLGAGKTTFVQGIAQALGVQEPVTSPTFVLEKIYALSGQPFDSTQGKKFSRLVHVDAYRLKGAHELEALGWHELTQDPKNLILLEWPERVEEAIPADAIRITLQHTDENTRTISY